LLVLSVESRAMLCPLLPSLSLPCFPYSYLSFLFYLPNLFSPSFSLSTFSIFSISAHFITFPPFHPFSTPPYLFSTLFPFLPYFFHPALASPPSSPSFSLTSPTVPLLLPFPLPCVADLVQVSLTIRQLLRTYCTVSDRTVQ
jgi:hypothetical protein